MALLEVSALSKRFGGLAALDRVDLSVEAGEIVSVIGPNGAGKTTFYNVVTGFLAPSGGAVRFDGQDVTRMPVHGRARLGMARTFQNIRLFPDLTALENVMVGQHSQVPRLTGLLPVDNRDLRDRALALLDLSGIGPHAQRRAGDLAYGIQKRIELARALASEPRMLLLDEPRAGLNPRETDAVAEELSTLRARGLTVLLVEHDMRMVMSLSDRIYVLNFGKKIAEGRPAEIRANPEVVEAYLGHDQ